MGPTGRCCCGAVRYELAEPPGPSINCHCQFCRRAHGAHYVTVAATSRSNLRWLAGEGLVREYRGTEGSRFFCSRCATRLYASPASNADLCSMVVATFDEEPERGPVAHVNLESSSRWHEIRDDLPQFQALPAAAERALEEGGKRRSG